MSIEPVTVAIIVAGANLAFTMFGGGIFMGRVTSRLDAHDTDTARIEASLTELRRLLVSSAVEADRLRRAEDDIQNLENTVEGLRRGTGWVKDKDAKSVDREY